MKRKISDFLIKVLVLSAIAALLCLALGLSQSFQENPGSRVFPFYEFFAFFFALSFISFVVARKLIGLPAFRFPSMQNKASFRNDMQQLKALQDKLDNDQN